MPGGEVDPDVDGGGHDHPADGRRDRQRGPARVAQIARDELALEFQPDDEEEDRQQPVGRPLRNAQVQMQRLGAEPRTSDIVR